MQLQKATNNADLLFVYGTLMSAFEGPYAVFLRQHAQLLGEASTDGSLYAIAWYPGLVKDTGSVVWGELYKVQQGEGFWSALDEYEGVDPHTLKGSEYTREIVGVNYQGKTLNAWTYVYTGFTRGAPIQSGRFTGSNT